MKLSIIHESVGQQLRDIRHRDRIKTATSSQYEQITNNNVTVLIPQGAETGQAIYEINDTTDLFGYKWVPDKYKVGSSIIPLFVLIDNDNPDDLNFSGNYAQPNYILIKVPLPDPHLKTKARIVVDDLGYDIVYPKGNPAIVINHPTVIPGTTEGVVLTPVPILHIWHQDDKPPGSGKHKSDYVGFPFDARHANP